MPGLPKRVVVVPSREARERDAAALTKRKRAATESFEAAPLEGKRNKPVDGRRGPQASQPASPQLVVPCAGIPGEAVRRCGACLVRSTPQWRSFSTVRGVSGPVVLCNACGVRYVRSGHLTLATKVQLAAKEEEEKLEEETEASAPAPAIPAKPAKMPKVKSETNLQRMPSPTAATSSSNISQQLQRTYSNGSQCLRPGTPPPVDEGCSQEEDTEEVVNIPYNMRLVPHSSRELDNSKSVVVAVNTRKTWVDAVDEMAALCAEAQRRACLKSMINNQPVGDKGAQPLSREYIAQRADVDDPVQGFMVRTRNEGWLQGFAWWTPFTTWTHFFKWDSLATQCGMRRQQDALAGKKIDVDGSLSKELEAQPRSGDPESTGVVWPTICEISMLGALGCGRTLMQQLLRELESKTAYKYVVLQATKESVGFYERLGFVRVGAVARYNHRKSGSGGKTEIVGYRHWLGTDDSIERSDRASYMMAYPLDTECRTPHCRCARLAEAEGTNGEPPKHAGQWLECGHCHKLFHRACIPTRSRVPGPDESQACWQCPTCQINQAADLACELQSTDQADLYRDSVVLPPAPAGLSALHRGPKSVAQRAHFHAAWATPLLKVEAPSPEEQEEGCLVMSQWGWVRHQPACPCSSCNSNLEL